MNARRVSHCLSLGLTVLAVGFLGFAAVAGCTPVTDGGGDGGGGGGTTGPDGAALYATNCAVCHADDGTGNAIGPNVVGTSASEITESIANVESMQNISLTAEEITAVATFLAP